ncbi:hypothetical protein V1506DRAFT_446935, partial [Lipomyces tetrasporus]
EILTGKHANVGNGTASRVDGSHGRALKRALNSSHGTCYTTSDQTHHRGPSILNSKGNRNVRPEIRDQVQTVTFCAMARALPLELL